MATLTTSTIIGLFRDRTAAESAVDALVTRGFSRDQISLVTADSRSSADTPNVGPLEQVGSGTDAGAGAAIGGLAGFIGGIVALAIPGIGPILAAGPLAAGIMGAGIGAATGGMIGALKSHGVPEDDASRFSTAIKRGRVMVSVHASENRIDDASDILHQHGAVDVDETDDVIPTTTHTETTSFRPAAPDIGEAAKLRPEDSLVNRQRERERRVYVYPGITGGGPSPTA